VIPRIAREFILLALLALVPAAISGALQLQWRKPQALREGEVRYETARLWGDAVLWVDSRSEARYTAGHLPGALILNDEGWEDLTPTFLDAWDPEKSVVVYGAVGSDSAQAIAHRLREELQLENVWVLQEPYETIQGRQ
jgi:rhodanese-related sulfurtransferase